MNILLNTLFTIEKVYNFRSMKSIHCLMFSCLLATLSGYSHEAWGRESIAPPREISIVNKDVIDSTLPKWMKLWEDARAAARIEDYTSAGQLYKRLYEVKPGIEEASWEYCKVLIITGDYVALKNVLDGLLEQAPNRSEYLLIAGEVALHNREYALAAHRFGKVFEKNPVGEEADIALRGLVESLRRQGKKRFAFPLLEQLALRNPKDLGIVSELARDAYLLEKNEKAHQLYGLLVTDAHVTDRILFQAAQLYEVVKDFDGVIGLWLRYLGRHPDYLPFREKVVTYYLQSKKFEEMVVHLEYLVKNIDKNGKNLLLLSDTYLYQLNRPDKALYYYGQYLAKNPDDEKIRQRVSDVQSYLANDFLSIVENDGAWMLWRDLAAIAPNRHAIYLEMADILEQKGKIKELIEILVIIFQATPNDDTLVLRLARNYAKLQEYEKSLLYFHKLSAQAKSKKVYLLMADAEHNLGRKDKELESLQQALRLNPLDGKILKSCLVLAGELGFVEKQIEIFDYVLEHDQHYSPILDLVTIHLHYLAENYMVGEFHKIYEWARGRFHSSPETQASLAILWADVLKKTGRKRTAEGLLRNLLHGGYHKDQILLKLVDISLEDGKYEDAEAWLKGLKEMVNTAVIETDRSMRCEIVLAEAKALSYKGLYQDALTTLQEQTIPRKDRGKGSADICSEYQLEKEKSKLFVAQGNYKEALRTIEKYKTVMAEDPEISVIQYQIMRGQPQPVEGDETADNQNNNKEDVVFGSLLDVSAEALKYKDFEGADVYLQRFLDAYPSSVLGMLTRADFFSATGRLQDAANILSILFKRFPHESYIRNQWLEVQMRLGEYEKALTVLKNSRNKTLSIDQYINQLFDENDIDNLVLLARILWGNKNQSLALEVYERLLSPSMAEIMSDQFDEKQIDFQFLTKEDNFWNSLLYLLQSEPKVIGELMQPSYLLDNLNTDAGRIVSENYEKYAWHRLAQNEYLARNATYKRKYLYAEQSYKRLLKEQDSTQGMLDLASIYERIGEYRKEAKIYEAIKSSGGSSPDLKESIARTSVELSPRTGVDGTYLEKSGRDGFKDLIMTSYGLSFMLTPNLNMDMRYQYEIRDYESFNKKVNTSSNILKGQTSVELGADYELAVQAGIEKFEDNSSTRLQYDLALTGQLDDYLKTYITVKKNPVTDTVIAVKEQIYYQGMGIGFNYDTPIGISIGGDYLHLNFDGDNSQQKYHWMTSYKIFSDSTELALQYDYNYISSENANSSSLTENVELNEDSLYYWSPDSFSEHALSVRFKHYFLGYREESRLTKSYYSLNSGFGSENDSRLSYKGGFDLFFEMGPRFLVNGNFTLERSDDYEEARLSLSVDYRW